MSDAGPTTGPAPLIDVHAHFLTEKYVAAARAAGHDHPDGMTGWPSWSADEHLRLMDQWGVERSILSISSPGVHFGDDQAASALARQVNDAGAGLAQSHPERFGHFASLPLPDVDGALHELARALDELGSDGIIVESNSDGVYLGNARYAPLYEELDRRRAIVFVHPTSPPAAERVALDRPRPMLEFIFDSARTFTDLVLTGTLCRYPGIKWVVTHGGGALPLLADRIELFRRVLAGGVQATETEPSVHDQIAGLWFDMAGTPFPRQIPTLVDVVGTGRLLYGSDYCWTPIAAVIEQLTAIRAAPQPADDTWQALTTRNARRLFST